MFAEGNYPPIGENLLYIFRVMGREADTPLVIIAILECLNFQALAFVIGYI